MSQSTSVSTGDIRQKQCSGFRRSFHTLSHNKAYATNYQATRVRPLVRLLRRLQLPKEGTFIDLGCGKGRVLIIASEFGFRRVVGVEFCAQLCQQARANAELFRERNPLSPPIEIIESDVTQFQLRGDERVFFLYNPFTPVVLSQTLQNIALSVSAVPRHIWLIYNTPLHHHTICDDGRFERSELLEIDGTEFRIYSEFNAAIAKVRSDV